MGKEREDGAGSPRRRARRRPQRGATLRRRGRRERGRGEAKQQWRELRRGSWAFVARKLDNGWKKSCATSEENCARAVFFSGNSHRRSDLEEAQRAGPAGAAAALGVHARLRARYARGDLGWD